MSDINDLYFQILVDKNQESRSKDVPLHQPELGIKSKIIPTAIADESDLKLVTIKNYSELKENSSKLKDFDYVLLKMHGGLGTSVERLDLIKEVEGRTKLGAKGTDLYFDYEDKPTSIFKLGLKQVDKLTNYKSAAYVALVNDETQDIIDGVTTIFQKKMPTIDESGGLTTERVAPAGHGFLGFKLIHDILMNPPVNMLTAIGNGEDLNSTPDELITSWMVENEIPVVMITTTKTAADKKGGQIAIVKEDNPYVAIVEKAQALNCDQLSYFEELGLRANDRESLFNTNIALINHAALKKEFSKLEVNADEFFHAIAPDVIRNTKTQEGKKFIQLESALGSVLLNLDKYFRQNFNAPIVSFLNLEVENRKKFFMPIKKREDYEVIKEQFTLSEELRLI
jgi:UDP-N-acetylglucosamine pyrophosphorylase